MRRTPLLLSVGLILIVTFSQANPTPVPTTAGADRATELNATVLRLLGSGRFREALPLAEEAVRLREATLGPNHPNVAVSLLNLAMVLRMRSQYERARAINERALSILESVLGPNHPAVAQGLNNLAEVFRARSEYERALSLHERALRIRESALGPNHPDVAASLNNIAAVFRAMGEYPRALPLHERALRIREAALGPTHPDVATSLNNLAEVFDAMGQYDRAVPLHERALRIRESVFGPNHPDVAASLNNLACVFVSTSRFESAIPLLERALRIREAALGPDHPDVANSLSNLADVFVSMGQYDRAMPLHERALRIREAALGPDHPDVAQSLNSLAAVFRARGQYERAVPLSERALRIGEAALGPDHLEVAASLNSLALVFVLMGQYDRALPLYERALRIRESALDPNHSDVALSLNNLAVVLYSMGRYESAVSLYERALHICEAALGPTHFYVATSLNNLALVLQAMGQYDRSVSLHERALSVLAINIQRIASHQQEERLQHFLAGSKGNADSLLTLAVEHRDDEHVRRLAFQVTLLFKARGEEEAIAVLATLRRSTGPEDRVLLAEWSAAQQRTASADIRSVSLLERGRLQDDLRAVEERLARRSSALRERHELGDLDALLPRLARHLGADAALVELVGFRPLDARSRTEHERWGAEHYAAFVLHSDGTCEMADLGEAAPLNALAQQLTALISDVHCTPEAIARAGQELEQRLFAPIAPLLHPGTHRLLLAPDGPLHLAPLHLMHDGRRWLLDRYTVSYVTSGRDLLRERSPLDTPGEPVALAVTRYADPSWNLPGLTTQADLLPRLVPGIRVLRDEAATEAALRNVSAPRILHIAAHGVFLGDGAGSAMQRGRLILADALPTPETREARVPTPATRDDGNDGVATAAELLTMNLRGTRLVVLSACETAQGSAAVGQGVFGLRRAFLLAGAEALVTTQWDVDERAGAVFTVALYEGLRAGMRSADAVARAARVVRERDPDPFAWAPFVLVGRDDTIDWASVPVRPAT